MQFTQVAERVSAFGAQPLSHDHPGWPDFSANANACPLIYGVFFYDLLCACAAAFFRCAFFSSSVSTLHSPIACLSESLEHVSICFWCETNQSFQNIPMWTSLFGLGHLLSSLQVVRPSQVRGSSEHSKHSAQFSLEIRFSMGVVWGILLDGGK